MRRIAIVVFATLIATPAFALSHVDGTIIKIDHKRGIMTMADRTIFQLPREIDGKAFAAGQKVRVFAEMDEDGFSPITAIETRQ